jgi:hypothetical protein
MERCWMRIRLRLFIPAHSIDILVSNFEQVKVLMASSCSKRELLSLRKFSLGFTARGIIRTAEQTSQRFQRRTGVDRSSATTMNILEAIRGWQMMAKSITPPEGTGILSVRGGLPGAAFFPEGFGLQNPAADAPWPSIMAIGHNFGCEEYRNKISTAGREDDKATWRNLRRLLSEAGVSIDSCFMTNWFVGLQPGDKQLGEFLSRPDSRYEGECEGLLREQIRTLRPQVILLLGLPVVGHAHRIISALEPWADSPNWSAVDLGSLGAVAYGVEIPGTGVKSNVVALLHPSFSPSNQRFRRSAFSVENPEVEMIRRAMAGTEVSSILAGN